MNGFEKFVEAGSSYAVRMSIRKSGQIGLSQGAAQRFGIKDANWFAVLYFNRVRNMIGVEFTRDKNSEGAHNVVCREHVGVQITHISARGFLDKYDVQYKDETRNYEPTQDEESGLILIDLNNPRETKTRTRKKTGEPEVEAEQELVPEENLEEMPERPEPEDYSNINVPF